MTLHHPTIAVSAPGKVFLAGGYLVLDQEYTAFVFGLDARINIIAGDIHTTAGVQLTEIVVDSPQFLEAQWRYGYHLAGEGGGIKVTQLQVGAQINPNPFVETTLSYALTYIDRVAKQRPSHSMASARLIILADNDYYSHSESESTRQGRFAKFPVTLGDANKTGLGSSAALVTSLTAALLAHYLPEDLFNIQSDRGKRTLHNLAQAAHCAAQGKVGSGFDVATAVYGSCRYRRFSPETLSSIPEPGAAGFADALVKLVDGESAWDVEVLKDAVIMPKGVVLRMCDVDCGSKTVGMVKKVLKWRSSNPEESKKLWDELQKRNEQLIATLNAGDVENLPGKITAVREMIRQMGSASDVPIEPESQTELLDALSTVEGVYGGVVPGAGGYDALALLMKDDEETKQRVEEFLDKWAKEKGTKVKLLGVKGEMEGVRSESLDVYAGWI
ncbi:phosphomevalonate kinase [Fusarium oxysporum f. sp. raphani 54005]|uniref:Phosphomevalonate kinase n=10 Tax=Fusarium oxysporum TaxID=5507 RepID=W9IVA0_FUSOX|nr:phosphomevalonate kinase [Fusarium oxysporum NRRL 32931]EXA01143.1 phosphomevalonate kinase [Fusarium oxysporum f. sp. lycopersici MN25]EXK92424.1 phosphomevalonate kinase [Fusarium oxysporum f. sp. raphani 54005]EXL59823.1 phosphomevalonate kinase [Fusarium oxysporum f. sp. radicis-lycopersici 26381]EXL87240.1 phosphomevalonate kinase [Fusarium oxysporum f. sp. conglutinans race 2 54008]EXM25466.1 phosphomevalonate kinase [Fusarium oxysporum f. sp. vasinfectum 25433]KAF6524224.1 hypotheti